jgi:Fe2+ or Zn2+ uptake regulation protein
METEAMRTEEARPTTELDIDDIARSLHKSGHRLSRLKRAVLTELATADRAFSAEELGSRMDTGADLSPLYRCLASLEHAGIVMHLNVADDSRRWALARGAHRDYLVCVACSAVEDQGRCALDRSALQAADNRGFLVQEHQVILRGVCPSCREDAGPQVRT